MQQRREVDVAEPLSAERIEAAPERAMIAAGRSTLDLAVIGNCQVSALIDRTGSIVWACWPQPDANPIFCALLRSEGAGTGCGVLAIELTDRVRSTQEYLRNSAVLTTELVDAHGAIVKVTDFCPRFRQHARLFRPTALVRIIEPVSGRPVIRLRMRPAFDYGAETPATTAGSHHLRYLGNSSVVRLTTTGSVHAVESGEPFVLEQPIAMIIGADETITSHVDRLAREWLTATYEYWTEWVRTLALPCDWQNAVIRAAITLKLCTFEDTGAVIAAITTSIPEEAGTHRTWDYRYCWLRDAFFVVQALNRLGATRTMEGFLRFIENLISKVPADQLRPVYRICGSEALEERQIYSLAGYRGFGPVRVGNAAVAQQQHDVYGSIVLAATQFFCDERLTAPGDEALFARLEPLGTQAVETFGRPDAGPWELRGTAHAHTYSAMMCWAACDRLARIAQSLKLADRVAFWSRQAQRLQAELLSRAWSESIGSFVSTLDVGEDLDATLLLMPELGLVDYADPRFLSTLRNIERRLVVNGFVMRYRHADDFGRPAQAFTVCTFWYANALAMVGRRPEAVRIFESVLAHRNHVGLLSEDIDPKTGELWGNFPQTYSLVGIITSALRLSRQWEQVV